MGYRFPLGKKGFLISSKTKPELGEANLVVETAKHKLREPEKKVNGGRKKARPSNLVLEGENGRCGTSFLKGVVIGPQINLAKSPSAKDGIRSI